MIDCSAVVDDINGRHKQLEDEMTRSARGSVYDDVIVARNYDIAVTVQDYDSYRSVVLLFQPTRTRCSFFNEHAWKCVNT